MMTDTLELGDALTLTYVSTSDHYSTYHNRDGRPVYLAHGTGRQLVALWQLDLPTLWEEHETQDHDEFREMLRGLTYDVDCIPWVDWCTDCEDPAAELRSTAGGGSVCESCLDDYSYCDDCEEYASETDQTLDETSVCYSCSSARWHYCEDCDGLARDGDEEHYHDDDDDDDDDDNGCCEAPHLSFTIRNDGEEPLANDTRVTVSLPAGVISAEGLDAIARYLRDQSDASGMGDLWPLSYALEGALGDRWQTKEGNYTKRLSRYAYKTLGLKLSPDIISAVGNLASAHSTGVDHAIEVTRDLNLPADDFGHEDSCWWSTYSGNRPGSAVGARCALKTNGGFGLRTFGGYGVSGRAWVLPLDAGMRPTHDTDSPAAFLVFNGYGDLSGYVPARILSHMAGWTYRKVSLSVSSMYVNSDAGYLVAPEELADRYTDGSVYLDLVRHA